MKTNHIVLLNGDLTEAGGAERLTFEEARYLEKKGFNTTILTFDFRKEVLFNQAYKLNIHVFDMKYNGMNFVVQSIYRIMALRKQIWDIKPDLIIASNSWDCTYLYFATLFTPFQYATHIHGSIFWFIDDPLKYALIHRKVFHEIRESVAGHQEFIPLRLRINFTRRVIAEFAAIAMYKAVRKAEKVFVLSNQMRWEISRLYDKDAVVLKGGFSLDVLNYRPKQDIKRKLGIENKKMILNVNRLDPRKRVDLLIKAFGKVSDSYDDVVLVIGGTGKDEKKLKVLSAELNLTNKIRFVGHIKEQELWDYYSSCDVMVHPNWAEFAIAPLEALALNKKVVWTTEMEIDETLKGNKYIFPADPTVDDFAIAIEKALNTEIKAKYYLDVYTWDRYCEGIMKELDLLVKG